MEGSSGLIVAFVVALWAAYFVPLVLRRYDEAAKNSSLDHDGPTRRVVQARRVTATAEERPVVHQRPVEPQAAEQPAEPSTTETSPRVDRTSPAVDAQRPRVTREAARIAARRRRNVLLTLVAVLAVLAGLTIARIVAVWTPAIGVGLIVGWLVLCRVMVRQERGIARSGGGRVVAVLRWIGSRLKAVPVALMRLVGAISGRMRHRAVSGGTAADEEMTVVVSDQVEDYDPNRRNVMEDVPLAADALDEQLQIAVPSVSAQTGEPVWDPLPITVPTYVSKPRAGRTVRTIEFGQPGAWTSGHIEGEQTELPDVDQGDDESGSDQHAVGH